MRTLLLLGALLLVSAGCAAAPRDAAGSSSADKSSNSASGLETSDLLARWWQWGVAAEPGNPVADADGSDCARGQSRDVWFLAGNFGGQTTRACTVPSGVPVFAPAGNTVCPVNGDVASAVDDCAMTWDEVSVRLDGTLVEAPYKESEKPFALDLPENNPVFDTSGSVQAVASGNWVGPITLADGAHTLRLRARSGNFVTDVTYQLVVGGTSSSGSAA